MTTAILTEPSHSPRATKVLSQPLDGTRRVLGLTKARAEDLLDWLEVVGLAGRVSWDAVGKSFVVEYDVPAR